MEGKISFRIICQGEQVPVSPRTWGANRARTVLLSFLSFFLLISLVHAEPSNDGIGKGTFGLGLNYPGIGIRYFLSDHYSLEAKGQIENSIQVGGLRMYRYFRPSSGIFLFGGLEGDYVHFKADVTRGSGYAGEVFAGCEYFILSRLGLQVDAGPSYIYIKDRNYSISASGIEYVLNVGINYYFGRGKSRETTSMNQPQDNASSSHLR